MLSKLFKNKFIVVILLAGFISGCLDDDSDSELIVVLNEPFYYLDEYVLADFTFSEDVDYWEIRLAETINGNVVEPEEILYVYDDDAFASLSNQQVADLDVTQSFDGFGSVCPPHDCPAYGVTVEGNSTSLIDSKTALLDLFDAIDTTAELHIWLWANEYLALSYELVPSGYLAVVEWRSCERRGERIVYVDFDGEISIERSIYSEPYNGNCD